MMGPTYSENFTRFRGRFRGRDPGSGTLSTRSLAPNSRYCPQQLIGKNQSGMLYLYVEKNPE